MARNRPGPRGAPAPGLPAPAPTPLPTFPPPAKPARSNANTSHPAARSAAHAGRTPSLPAGSAAGAGTASPRGMGPPSPPKSPHLGVPWEPAKPWGAQLHRAGLGARRDGASVSQLLLRNADDSENAAFPPRSNAWPRVTPAPSPGHPRAPNSGLAERGSCPQRAPAPPWGGQQHPQTGTRKPSWEIQMAKAKPGQGWGGGAGNAPPKPPRGLQLGPSSSHLCRCPGLCLCQGGAKGQSPPATFLLPWKSRMCHPPPLFLPLSTPGQGGLGGRRAEAVGTQRLPSLESRGSRVGRKEAQEHFQEAPVPGSRFPKGWGGGGSAPAPPPPPEEAAQLSPCSGGCVTQAEPSKA